jgi:hypothetical protein
LSKLPEPTPELQELLRLKLKPYSVILLSKQPVKTQEKVPDERFVDSTKHEPYR